MTENPDVLDVPLAPVYEEMKDMDEQFWDEILDIIRNYILERERHELERLQYEKECNTFVTTLTSDDLTQINKCLDTLDGQPVSHVETKQSEVNNETQQSVITQKRKALSPEQILILEREFMKSRSISARRCEELSEIINVSPNRIKLWFKKRRLSNDSQPSSNGTVKLTLRLKKQSKDTSTWSVMQQNTNDSFVPAAKSSTCSRQQGLASALQPSNLKVQDEASIAKPSTSRLPRSKLNAEQQAALEVAFSKSQFIVGKKRSELAEQLGLTAKKVANWFEYRRRLIRKRETREESVPSTSTQQNNDVDATVMVKQESFETPLYSSTPARMCSFEDYDSQSSGYGSAFSSASSSSKPSPTHDEIPLWVDHTEEIDDFDVPMED